MMRAGSQDDWTTEPARFDFVDTYFGRDDEVTRGMVDDYLDRIEHEAIVDATERLILAFRQWHLDRHGHAPSEHDFRLILDMARAEPTPVTTTRTSKTSDR